MPRSESGSPLDINKKIVIVENQEAVEAAARDKADAEMTESKESLNGPRLFRGENRTSKEQLKGFGNLFRKIWKHNLFHEVYRQKEIAKARAEIENTKNLYANEGGDQAAHDQAMKSVVERFAQDYEEAVHTEAGEERRKLSQEGEDAQRQGSIKQLITDYATGRLSVAAFNEEKIRVLSGVTGMDRKALESQVRHTDNLLEIANQVKAAVDHGQRLEDLDLNFDVIVGKAKSGVRTEAQFNTVDRIVDKIQKTSIGKFVNETTLATAVATLYSVSAGLSQRVARSKALAWGTFGLTALVGGGVAAARESRRITEERRQHGREMAQGKAFDDANSPRRQEMERYRHETQSAKDLTERITALLEKPNLNQQEAEDLAKQLADVAARIELSDRQKIDLISYSHVSNVEKERLDLDIARAKARVKLNQSHPNWDQHILTQQVERVRDLSGELSERDRAFAKLKRNKVLWAAGKGLLTGLVVGGAFQEAAALARDNQHGVVEGMFGDPKSPREIASITPLERLRMYLMGDTYNVDPLRTVEFKTPDGGIIKLPDNMSFLETSPGTYNLVEDGTVVAGGLHFAQGQLTPESALALKNAGIDMAVRGNLITEMSNQPGDLNKYVAEHSDQFKRIHRTMWYDNDTPKPVFDKNELRLDWGAKAGVDANGNFVFNMSRMQPDGSYHSNFSVDAKQALAAGKLRMLLSLTRDTQMTPVELPIDANGNIIVDPKSEIGKMFFKIENGKAVFLGKFAEVAEVTGKAKDGFENMRILATHVGKDAAGVPIVKEVPITDVLTPTPDVEPPPIIPLFGRRPLEPTVARRPEVVIPPVSGSESGAESGAESGRRLRRDSSGRERREARDLQNDIIEVYFAGLSPAQKQERLVLLQELFRRQRTPEEQREFLQFADSFYAHHSGMLADRPYASGLEPEHGEWDSDVDDVVDTFPAYRRLSAEDKKARKYYLKDYLNKNRRGVRSDRRKPDVLTSIRLLNIFGQATERTRTRAATPSPEVTPKIEALRAGFDAKPLAYVYGKGLETASGAETKLFIEAIRNKYGITEDEYTQIQAQAANMPSRKGASSVKKEIALIMRLAVKKNPAALASIKSSSSKSEYEKWVSDVVYLETKDQLAKKTLNGAEIDRIAQEFGVQPEVIINAAISSNQLLAAEASRRYGAVINRPTGALPKTKQTRNLIQKQTLEEYQDGRLSDADLQALNPAGPKPRRARTP